MGGISLEALLDHVGVHPMAPALDPSHPKHFGLDAQTGGQFVPQKREMSGFIHQHMVARAQGVDQGGFPSAGARRGINHDGVLGFENLLHVSHQLQPQGRKFRTAVVDGGQAHGPQDAVWHRRGPGDLQEVAASGMEV